MTCGEAVMKLLAAYEVDTVFGIGNEAISRLAHRLQCINHRVTPSLGMTAAGFSS